MHIIIITYNINRFEMKIQQLAPSNSGLTMFTNSHRHAGLKGPRAQRIGPLQQVQIPKRPKRGRKPKSKSSTRSQCKSKSKSQSKSKKKTESKNKSKSNTESKNKAKQSSHSRKKKNKT